MANSDPYYNRKPVPDAFLESVGDTGLTKQEEYLARERKLSSDKGDLRKFFDHKDKSGTLDPHYARHQVPDSMLSGVGETGLSKEEEYQRRESKMYDSSGVDIRRFSASSSGGMAPQNDPYYGRKGVDTAQIDGVGDSGISRAEEYETRENKAALFDLSKDPFQQLSGSGHRGSVSAVASAGAADARRRSSVAAAANMTGHNSGYTGDKSLPATSGGNESLSTPNYGTSTTTTTTTTTTSAVHHPNTTTGEHTYHDTVTHDPDSVAPDQMR